MKKIIISMIIMLNIILISTPYTKAVQFVQTSAPKINQTITKDSGMDEIIKTVGGISLFLCSAAATIVLVVKGVQFMNAAPEGKAEIKKQMIAIVIGATIVFSITAILNIIASITDTLV